MTLHFIGEGINETTTTRATPSSLGTGPKEEMTMMTTTTTHRTLHSLERDLKDDDDNPTTPLTEATYLITRILNLDTQPLR